MKLLVTGGAGFIGSEFVRQSLLKGHEVVVVDKLSYAGDLERLNKFKNDYMFYQTDLINKEFIEHIFKVENPDSVVHWAAESHVDRSIFDATPFIDSNTKGTQILLDCARKSNVSKFINIATDEVYGDLGDEGQFFENTPLSPNSPYAVSKTAADMLGRSYYRTYNLPVITVRPSNNYGAWQYPEKLVPVVILKALSNEKIPVYGKGLNIREWLFVSDCADAVMNILEKGKVNEIYNVGSAQEKRNIDVVKFILNYLSKSENLIEFVKDRLGHDYRYSINFDKIAQELNWQPKIKFEEGMKQTIDWYLGNSNWVNKKLKIIQNYWLKAY